MSVIIFIILKKMSDAPVPVPKKLRQWTVFSRELEGCLKRVIPNGKIGKVSPSLTRPDWFHKLNPVSKQKIHEAGVQFIKNPTSENLSQFDEVFKQALLTTMSMDSSGSCDQVEAILITEPEPEVQHNVLVKRLAVMEETIFAQNDIIKEHRVKFEELQSEKDQLIEKLAELEMVNEQLAEENRLFKETLPCNLVRPQTQTDQNDQGDGDTEMVDDTS